MRKIIRLILIGVMVVGLAEVGMGKGKKPDEPRQVQELTQNTTTMEINKSTTTEVQIEEYVPKVIIEGKWGSGPGEFGVIGPLEAEHWGVNPEPSSLAVDSKGNIYILDHINNRIQKFDKDGKYQKIIPVEGFRDKGRIKGINILIDSQDNLYYYCIKGDKGEVLWFKEDELREKKEVERGNDGLRIQDNKLWIKGTDKMFFLKDIIKGQAIKPVILEVQENRNNEYLVLNPTHDIKFTININEDEKLRIKKAYLDKEINTIRVPINWRNKAWFYYYNTKGTLILKKERYRTNIIDGNDNCYRMEILDDGVKVTKYELKND